MSNEDEKEIIQDELNDAMDETTETQQEQKEKPKKKKIFGRKDKSEELKVKINDLEQELGEAKDKYLRLFAEFDNFKKRTVKERIDFMSTAGRETIAAILPVLDDFDRAKKSAEDDDSIETFSEGVALVYNKLHGIMKSKGVVAMESTGQDFDPELHEAITEIPAPSEDMKGKVIDTIENGYLLNDKIIRHAKVVVGK